MHLGSLDHAARNETQHDASSGSHIDPDQDDKGMLRLALTAVLFDFGYCELRNLLTTELSTDKFACGPAI
jgi:hypothetical protein